MIQNIDTRCRNRNVKIQERYGNKKSVAKKSHDFETCENKYIEKAIIILFDIGNSKMIKSREMRSAVSLLYFTNNIHSLYLQL